MIMEEERRRLALPDRRKTTYEELEKKLDEHVEEIRCEFEKWLRRGLIAFSIIALTSAVALIGFGINLRGIQNARKEFVRNGCVATNNRHDRTYTKLTNAAQADQDKAPNEAARVEIRRRRDVTLALIDSLQPKQDCDYQVKIALGKVKPPPRALPEPNPANKTTTTKGP